jgi:hypothetical protein
MAISLLSTEIEEVVRGPSTRGTYILEPSHLLCCTAPPFYFEAGVAVVLLTV